MFLAQSVVPSCVSARPSPLCCAVCWPECWPASFDDMRQSPVTTKFPAPDWSASGTLDTDDLRLPIDNPIAPHRGKSLVDGVFAGCVGDQDHGHRLLRSPTLRGAARSGLMTLHDRFQRNFLLRQAPRNRGCRARSVAGEKPDVIATFMMLHRRLADRGHAR